MHLNQRPITARAPKRTIDFYHFPGFFSVLQYFHDSNKIDILQDYSCITLDAIAIIPLVFVRDTDPFVKEDDLDSHFSTISNLNIFLRYL